MVRSHSIRRTPKEENGGEQQPEHDGRKMRWKPGRARGAADLRPRTPARPSTDIATGTIVRPLPRRSPPPTSSAGNERASAARTRPTERNRRRTPGASEFDTRGRSASGGRSRSSGVSFLFDRHDAGAIVDRQFAIAKQADSRSRGSSLCDLRSRRHAFPLPEPVDFALVRFEIDHRTICEAWLAISTSAGVVEPDDFSDGEHQFVGESGVDARIHLRLCGAARMADMNRQQSSTFRVHMPVHSTIAPTISTVASWPIRNTNARRSG